MRGRALRLQERARRAKRKIRQIEGSYRFTSELFDELIKENRGKDRIWLDAGCGRNGLIEEFKGDYGLAVGVDQGQEGSGKFVRADLSHLPFKENRFDFITCKWVMEHIACPQGVLNELRRVLAPGGRLLIQTPNRNHFLLFCSRLLPPFLKSWLIAFFFGSHQERFPTFYLANTPSKLRRFIENGGLKVERMVLNEDLFSFSRLGFWFSYFFWKLTAVRSRQGLRSSILLLAQRQ